MPILPLPQFEADVKEQLAAEDRAAYEALRAPKTLVVRFGSMKLIGEFQLVQPQHGPAIKPGCGSKVVVRTFRGTELGEMLTSTCPNSGCGKSVSRQEMLQYIENSGGQDYPFFTEGRVVRLGTQQDLDAQAALEQSKHGLRLEAKAVVERLIALGGNEHLRKVKIVEVEPVLGGESVTVYFMSEERIEFRDLTRELQNVFRSRVEVRGVGARDEARLTADYEKCGQYCCCKNFLKVLKPVSMKSAKVQKATLDPLKISGRCGRLMCCLRYEDQTYEDLAKNLPRKKSRVGTPEGDGIVLDSQILTQLVLVLLDDVGDDGKERQVAVPVESLTPPKDVKGPSASLQDRLKAMGPGGPRRPAPTPTAPVIAKSGPESAEPSEARAEQARIDQARTEQAGTAQPRGGEQRPPRRDGPRPNDRGGGQQRDQNHGNRPQNPQPRPQGQQGQQGQQGRGPRPQGPGGQRPPQQGGGQGGGQSSAPRQPRSRDDEIDELMGGDIVDDLGGPGGPPRRGPKGPRPNNPGGGQGGGQGGQGRGPQPPRRDGPGNN